MSKVGPLQTVTPRPADTGGGAKSNRQPGARSDCQGHTELAAAGIDLLVLRDLMGHASPETTGKYVHLSAETLAAEYTAARQASPW